jgi:hypothetical protein
MNANTAHKPVPIGSVDAPPSGDPVTTTLKAIAEVKNLTATTATLDGSKSEGQINWAMYEMVSPSPASHPNVFPNWNKGGIVKDITNLKPGTDYEFRLTLNGSVSGNVKFKTPALNVSPVFVEASIPSGKTKVIVREDKTVEFI